MEKRAFAAVLVCICYEEMEKGTIKRQGEMRNEIRDYKGEMIFARVRRSL